MGRNVVRIQEFSALIQGLVDNAMKQKGVSGRALSLAVVGHDGLVRDIKSGKLPSIDTLDQLFKELGIGLEIGQPTHPKPPEIVVLDSDDYVAVPRLDVRLSAGPGSFNHDPAEVEKLAFRRDWLSRLGVRPADAVLVGVSGDSMAPGLRDGDVALVDGGRKTPTRSGLVYALTDIDGSTRVKRIDLVKDGYILRSDAPDYPVEARFGSDAKLLSIAGLVVWSGHSWAV